MAYTQAVEKMAPEEAVRKLAGWHWKNTTRTNLRIFGYCGEDEVVRLLEVSPTHGATNGEIHAIRFGATKELPKASEVILVTPEEYARLSDLELPRGWDMARLTEVPRS
jgi:hypothetical protein